MLLLALALLVTVRLALTVAFQAVCVPCRELMGVREPDTVAPLAQGLPEGLSEPLWEALTEGDWVRVGERLGLPEGLPVLEVLGLGEREAAALRLASKLLLECGLELLRGVTLADTVSEGELEGEREEELEADRL